MLKQVKRLLEPPIFHIDEDKARAAQVLYILLTNILILMVPATLAVIFITVQKTRVGIFLLILFILILISWALLRKRHVLFASRLFVTGLWTLFISFYVLGGRTASASMNLLLATAVIAGILLGKRSAIMLFGLNSLIGLGMAILESRGYPFVQYFPGPPIPSWATWTLALLLTIAPLNLTLQISDQSLRRAHKSEARYRTLFEQSPDGIVILNPETLQPVEFNDRVCRQLGYARDEFAKLTLKDIEAADTIAESLAHIQKIVHEGHDDFETRQYTKQGETRDVYVTAQLTELEGHSVIHCIWRDITERKQAGQELRRWADIFENVAWGIVVGLPDGKKLEQMNPAFATMHGYTSAELTGAEIASVFAPECRADLPGIIQKAHEIGHTVVETKHIRKDGTVFPVLLSIAVVKNIKGEPLYRIVTVQDITERKLAEEKLHKSQELFQKLFNLSPVAYVLSRLSDYTVVDSNQATENLLEYSKADLVGQVATTVDFWADPSERQKTVEKILRDGQLRDFEFTYKTKSGRVGSAISYVNLFEQGGEKYALSSFLDITERKQAEKQLLLMKRLYATLSQVNQTIVRVKTQEELYRSICDVAAKFGDFSLVWIGLLDDASGDIRPVSASSLDVNHWPFPIINIYNEEHSNSLTALAMRTSKVVTSNDILTDSRAQRFRSDIEAYAFHAVAVIPFYLRGKAFGELVLISQKIERFEVMEELRLFEEMSLDISFALDTMQTERERKQAGDALRKSEHHLHEAQRIAHIGSWEWDFRTGETRWSPENYVIHGLSQDSPTLTAETLINYVHPDDREKVNTVISEAISEGKSAELDYRIFRPDGSMRVIHAVGVMAEFDAEGQPVLMVGTNQDITERKQAEESLRVSEERAQAMVQAIPDMMFRMDRSGIYLDYKADIKELYYQSESLIGKRNRDVAPLKFADLIEQQIQKTLSTGKTQTFEYQLPVPTIGDQDFEARMTPIGSDEVIAIVRNITERKYAEKKISQKLKQLNGLHEIDIAISSSFDINVILDIALRQVNLQLNVDAAAVLLIEYTTHIMKYVSGKGFRSPAFLYEEMKLGDGLASRAIVERRPIHIADLTAIKDTATPRIVNEGFVEYFGIPLITKGEVQGVLELFYRSRVKAIDTEWLEFMETLAGQIAIAIDNANLYKGLQLSNDELEVAYDATITGWSQALDMRDKETEGHTQRVTTLTLKLTEQLGIPPHELIHIRRGALLHDIGKLGVPDHILFKPGKLTDEEWEIMHKHPTFAHEMLSSIIYLQPALSIPYCHHEKWDGTGYPRGLKGEEIPLAARIFSIVDVWDALTSDRPYRAAWNEEQALEYIAQQSGKHFDPKIVDAFIKLQSS